jgi:hypothetical protein
MPFPYFENISTNFPGEWSSSRKRTSAKTKVDLKRPVKRKANSAPCPHTMAIVRSSRQLTAERERCPICLEDYFSTLDKHTKVTPVKMECTHIFCRNCVETHLSSSITCPLPWCQAHLPIQPNNCELCAAWQRDHTAAEPLVVTVRPREMVGSIKDALARMALEDDFFQLTRTAKNRLLAHVRDTLKLCEWQFHTGVDLAELLDPFLLAVDRKAVRKHYGPDLSSPAPNAAHFPRSRRLFAWRRALGCSLFQTMGNGVRERKRGGQGRLGRLGEKDRTRWLGVAVQAHHRSQD